MLEQTQSQIVVSMATFNRPKGLKVILDGIESQDVSDCIGLRVLVVDNSDDATAKAYVESRAKTYRWPLSYQHETQRGISFARNRGLENALDNGDDYIAFVDDDVIIEQGWINELFAVASDTGAAAVSGAVKAKYLAEPPWWIAESNFFDVLNFPDRQPVDYGHTTNALVKLSCIRDLNLRFDPAFALTGGEDTLFFKSIKDGGYATVFSRHALTYECVGPERLKLSWWLKRWYRTGNVEGLITIREANHSLDSKLRVLMIGLNRTFVGGLGALIMAPLIAVKNGRFFQFIRIFSRGLGYLVSLTGHAYEEYKNHNR